MFCLKLFDKCKNLNEMDKKEQQEPEASFYIPQQSDDAQITKLFLVVRTSMRRPDLNRAIKQVVFSIISWPICSLPFDLILWRLQCEAALNRDRQRWRWPNAADDKPYIIYMPIPLYGEFSIELLNTVLKKNGLTVSIECDRSALVETSFDFYVEIFKQNRVQPTKLEKSFERQAEKTQKMTDDATAMAASSFTRANNWNQKAKEEAATLLKLTRAKEEALQTWQEAKSSFLATSEAAAKAFNAMKEKEATFASAEEAVIAQTEREVCLRR